jgi:outer membrane protein OmpA-like peptidoglycan-associated protein
MLATMGMLVLAPSPAGAQVWKAIKQKATEKAEARKARADSAIIARTSRTMDSTLEKAGRGVDSATDRVASLADSAVSKTEQGVTSVVKRRPGETDRLAADLADDGRIVLAELRFTPDDQLAPGSEALLRQLAQLLGAQTGAFLVEGHVAPGTAADADRQRSERRAAAVKAQLVAMGMPAARLFAIGAGSAPAAAGPAGPPPPDRIEIARMQ